ncbi:hypothetical protein [Fructilactobacillus frigidiflavus]|uniref:hypothetical protein n=1 Tax=Fructilactobacillus frigidiflavus TaxID=3242688 RepID=UPI00375691EE
MKTIVENEVFIPVEPQQVIEKLANLGDLIRWIPDVKVSEIDENTVSITRNSAAVNHNEILSRQVEGDQVIYTSTGGRIEYVLAFKVCSENNDTIIVEEFILTNEINLPITLFRPVIKHAFKVNLQNLAKIMVNDNE